MKIIFLDDSDQRWYKFQSKVPNSFRAETAKECIALIDKSPVIDWLFLDHDLGGEAYVDSAREDCGMEVVRYLCKNTRTKSIKNILVHSHNTVAAEEMYNRLKESGYSTRLVPFSNLISIMEFNPDNEDQMAED
jgi:hypothetical protein